MRTKTILIAGLLLATLMTITPATGVHNPNHNPPGQFCQGVNLVATQTGPEQVTLTVASPVGTPFDVERNVGSGWQSLGVTKLVNVDGIIDIDSAAVQGSLNEYRITAATGEKCSTSIFVPYVAPECTDLDFAATLQDNGTILLTFNALPALDFLEIYRGIGASPLMVSVAVLPNTATSYLDENTVSGQLHVYAAHPSFEQAPLEPCRAEATVPEEPVPTCQDIDLIATALEGGSIHLGFTPIDGTGQIRIYRSLVGDDPVQIATLPGDATGYLDENTTIGSVYEYWVVMWGESGPLLECYIETTAIPNFGTVLASSMAIGLGLMAYVAVSRRRQ